MLRDPVTLKTGLDFGAEVWNLEMFTGNLPVQRNTMKPHKLTTIFLPIALLALFAGNIVAAPMGTAFTYQGRLADGGNPAQGIYDLRFTIYDSATTGNAVAGPLTNSPVGVTNGLFTTALDFGTGVFAGDARWLEIGVRSNGVAADFTLLSPRQPLTPAPYALFAPSANMANSASNVLDVLPGGLLSGTYSNALNFNNPANSFSGNGSQLTGIGTSALADNSVTSAKILDGAVATADIADSAVTTAKLADNSVTSAKIVDGTITSADIGDGQVATVDLAANAVTTAKLADSSVTSAKIVDGTVSTADLADSAVTTVKLADNSVTSAKIVDGTITSADIGDGQVATVDLAANAVITAKLADSSVTSLKIVDGSVSNVDIADLAINTAKLADNSVTSAKIVDGTITTADLAANAVTTAKLADSSVTSAKIVDGTVTSSDLASDSGSLYYVTGGHADVNAGKIGIGTPSPQATLDVLDAYGTNDTGTIHVGGSGANGDAKLVKFGDGSYVYVGEVGADDRMQLCAAGFVFTNASGNGAVGIGRGAASNQLEVEGNASKTSAGSWLANSDARIKTDIVTVTNALDTLGKVRLVSFRYTDNYRAKHPSIEDRPYLNVVAQEFQRVFPDYVKSSGEPLDGQDILQVDSYPLTVYSAAAVQELNRKLEQSLKAKDAEIELLKARLAAVEELVQVTLHK